eukprot:scaffold17032_cov73-Phaeocystis_antarctica.AAC.3
MPSSLKHPPRCSQTTCRSRAGARRRGTSSASPARPACGAPRPSSGQAAGRPPRSSRAASCRSACSSRATEQRLCASPSPPSCPLHAAPIEKRKGGGRPAGRS